MTGLLPLILIMLAGVITVNAAAKHKAGTATAMMSVFLAAAIIVLAVSTQARLFITSFVNSFIGPAPHPTAHSHVNWALAGLVTGGILGALLTMALLVWWWIRARDRRDRDARWDVERRRYWAILAAYGDAESDPVTEPYFARPNITATAFLTAMWGPPAREPGTPDANLGIYATEVTKLGKAWQRVKDELERVPTPDGTVTPDVPDDDQPCPLRAPSRHPRTRAAYVKAMHQFRQTRDDFWRIGP